MKKINDLLPGISGRHLADEETAMVIDALGAGREPRLAQGPAFHLENCPECQGKILEIHQYLKAPLAQSATLKLPDVFSAAATERAAWLPMFGRIAAAFFAAVLLAVMYFSWQRMDPLPEPARSAKPAAASQEKFPASAGSAAHASLPPAKNRPQAGQKENLSARRPEKPAGRNDAFAVNRNLEFMVGSRSRSFIVEVYAPANRATLQNNILFSWREFDSEPLSLVILNNRNETVAKMAVGNGRCEFREELSPGCYYWKLESVNELYYVGKFFIAAGTNSPR